MASIPKAIRAFRAKTKNMTQAEREILASLSHQVGDIYVNGTGYQESKNIDHPQHYGGDTPYEAIKVIEAWGLGFNLGNTVKYISRAGKKRIATELEDLKKAKWYLEREIANREKQG